jgi:hypothetical protein
LILQKQYYSAVVMDPSTNDVLLLLQTGLRIPMVEDGVANP